MSYDTSADPRILVAQRACAVLKSAVKQKSGAAVKISRDRVAGLVSECDSSVMTLMYMYQEPEILAVSQPVSQLTDAAAALAAAYGDVIASQKDRSLLRANIRWCVRILGGLAARFGHSARSLAAGIDLQAVQVQNVFPQGNFLLTRVSDGLESYSVVTNLKGVSSNTRLAAAFLPPREIGGEVSEAMFLGGGERNESPGTRLGEDAVDAKEVVAVLYEEVGRTSR